MMGQKWKALSFFLMVCFLFSGKLAWAGTLFEGESIETGAGFPAIYKFIAGDKDKPLLVMVPGAHHSARIFYGGHKGAVPQDFVAHWLVKKGYNILALSYPIALADPAIETNHPDFNVTAWGKQAADLAEKAIKDHGLKNEVILMGWSMGGKIPGSAYKAMKEKGLNLDFYIALTATVPMPGMIALGKEFPMLESGYAERHSSFSGWFKQVAAQGKKEGHEIIPEKIYMSQYVGDISIGQQGYGQVYKDGKFVMDMPAMQQDMSSHDYGNFPLVGVIAPSGRGDSRHAIVDVATWSFYNANTIYKRYLKGNEVSPAKLSDAQWQGLLDVSENIGSRLLERVEGNHFFFVGEDGARATANAIERIERKVDAVKSELTTHLGVPIQ